MADEYMKYIEATGLRQFGKTEGNRGAYVLRRLDEQEAEFIVLSLWESMDAIGRFAGPEPERAVYFPEDRKFLIDQPPNVIHYEVLAGDGG
jgi:heme-degrading monooxygenase HmoA